MKNTIKKITVTLVLFLVAVLFTFQFATPEVEARCNDTKPDHAPELFQIDTTSTTANLFFTPVNNAISSYSIFYGYYKGDERFGVTFSSGQYDGVKSFMIGALNPNTKYYFKVVANNGCRLGYWSDSLSARTDGITYTRYH